MTATASAVAPRRYRFSILRTLLCGVLLSLLVAACLYIDHTAVAFAHERLLAAEMKTSAWLVDEFGLILPLIVMCLFPLLVYSRHDRRDGDARREMMWEIVIVAVLIYGVLLPYLSNLSAAMYEAAIEAGDTIPKTEGKVHWTLLMKMHEWFVRLPIPLSILILYHKTRADRERKYPEAEDCSQPMTIAEYEAIKAAEAAKAIETVVMAEATAADADTSADTMEEDVPTVPVEEVSHG